MLNISLRLAGLNIYFYDVFFQLKNGFKMGYIEIGGFFYYGIDCKYARSLHFVLLESYNKKLMWLNQNEEFYDAQKKSLEIKKRREIDSILSMKLSKRWGHKKLLLFDLEKKKKEMENDTKIKTIIEFS